MEKPLLILKPNLAVAIIPTIIGTFFSAMFLGIILWFVLGSWWGIALGSIEFVIIVFFRLMNLRARKYFFFAKKAEFFEGFLTIVNRTAQYSRVTDVILVKTVWDRLFGTGTLRLVTAGHGGTGPAMIGSSSWAGSGITMQYINNPDSIHQELQKLVK